HARRLLRCVLLPSPLHAAGLERTQRCWLRIQGVSYVSEHLFPMSPVYTAKQKKSELPPGNPRLVDEPQKPGNANSWQTWIPDQVQDDKTDPYFPIN
ncbi:hypothetical protein, partial [Polaromonas sp. AER18D-145]|uniref:hypothetical protein n=1 Tax=Polaromonas sp. AER18D-145 TaxID=1977060 RepID=UPI00197C3F3A